MTYKCPECGHRTLIVDVVKTAVVEFSGDPDIGHTLVDTPESDTEWDDDSRARCEACGHSGNLGEFHETGPEDVTKLPQVAS